MKQGKAKPLPPRAPVQLSKKDQIRQLLKAHPGIGTSEVSLKVGCVASLVQLVRTELGIPRPVNSSHAQKSAAGASAPAPRQHVTIEEDGMAAVASSLSGRIHTLDQLLKATKVDLSVWEVERHIINKWEVAMKEESSTGKVTAITEPLVQVKAWLKRKAPQVVGLQAALTQFVKDAARVPVRPRPVRYSRTKGGCLAEIDLFDVHFGKLCWAAETGEDYDVKIAARLFKEAVLCLRDSCLPYGIARFLLPIGNDFLNVDNAARTTTAGTPQDEDGRWQRTFTGGLALMIWAVDTLLESAPVDIVVVPGNHDSERLYYLACALGCQYRTTKGVTIDNRPTLRKYVEFGNTFLGFTHSDKELEKNLPLIMAVEQKEAWARAKFREFHCGHRHTERQRDFQPTLEHLGVIVRHLVALSAADAWHTGKGYRARRGSTSFVHHPERGLIAELKFNL